jgi:transcriptional regulator with XRE-family HTH domain
MPYHWGEDLETEGVFMLIHKLRLRKGWSQEELAALSGVSVRTIQRLERGRTASAETLKALAAVFEVDFTDLQEELPMPNKEPVPAALGLEEYLALRHVRKLRAFYVHLAIYLCVNAGLVVSNLLGDRHVLWFWWPLLCWGAGLLVHAAGIFGAPFLGGAWERRQVEKRLGRPL